MALVARQHQDDENQLSKGQDPNAPGGAQPPAAAPQAQLTPQASQATPTGAAPAGGGSAPAAAPKASRFQNIQRLLDANKGEGQNLANRAMSTAGNLANTAQQQLSNAQSAYGRAAQAGTARLPAAQTPIPTAGGAGGLVGGGRTLVGQTAAAVGNAIPDWGHGGQAAASTAPVLPTATPISPALRGRQTTQINTAITPENTAALQPIADATYTGPTSLLGTPGVDASGLMRSFSDAGSAANALRGGVSSLLGESGGAGAFDNLLATHEAGGQLGQAAGRFSKLKDMLGNAVGDTSATDAGRAATATAAQGAQGRIAAAQDAENYRSQQGARDFNSDQQRQAYYDDAFQQFATGLGVAGPTGSQGWQADYLRDHPGTTGINNFTGTFDHRNPRGYYDQNADEIIRWMTEHGHYQPYAAGQ